MSSVDETGLQEPRTGYEDMPGEFVHERGFGRSPSKGRYYTPQAHSAFGRQGIPSSYLQGQAVGRDEFVDENAHVVRGKGRGGGKVAAFLGLSWCFSSP